jgi:hypothetical protein
MAPDRGVRGAQSRFSRAGTESHLVLVVVALTTLSRVSSVHVANFTPPDIGNETIILPKKPSPCRISEIAGPRLPLHNRSQENESVEVYMRALLGTVKGGILHNVTLDTLSGWSVVRGPASAVNRSIATQKY